MKTTVVFFVEGQKGRYIQVIPDFDKGEFVPNDILPINGLSFRTFGLSKKKVTNAPLEPYQSRVVIPLKEQESARLSAFKLLVDSFYSEAKERDFEISNILIQMNKNHPFWQLSVDYQFLLREKEV